MSRKPDFAQDINQLTERTDQNLLRLLDHAKRDDQQSEVGPPLIHTKHPVLPQEVADGAGHQDNTATTSDSPVRKQKAAPEEAPQPLEARKTFTTQLPPSTIKRLKRATSHQHLNELQPDTIQGIVHEAIEEWCNKRNYA